MTPDQHAKLEQVAREWLKNRGLLCEGHSDLERKLDAADIASLVTLLADQRAAVLEEAAGGYEQRRQGYLEMLKGPCFEHERVRLGAKEELLDVLASELRQKAQEQRA